MQKNINVTLLGSMQTQEAFHGNERESYLGLHVSHNTENVCSSVPDVVYYISNRQINGSCSQLKDDTHIAQHTLYNTTYDRTSNQQQKCL